MKKFIFSTLAVFFATFSFAQIEGKWKTIDDETGKAKSIVEISKNSNGQYVGKIIQLVNKPANNNCVKCTDDRKNKPLIGLEIIRGLKKEGNDFTGGTIMDPSSGKVYKCTIKRQGDELNVRGYIGFSLIGRTQTWHKVN
ncbi:DUF2147 domain-containing protein [Chryseobacterium sp. MFBS3-17]|uniref:DUF2147 domain-containing protein n=1 Tax=Chryseobacterium sp. MFBS3-17 TaxID=2886689 RepID=UPI001D0E8EA5|nr:DUF2147 domain-containing protein [Chryseobacterium sp. MFBS3-17]MCC2590798.1 DUF2147 domain-containing protein [Chryseobacterium sp. MFBS3-17]